MEHLLTLDEVKKYWNQKTWGEGETFNLFIDNPFCIQQCLFCIYQSTESKINSPEYLKYYQEYLPGLLNEFEDILISRPLDTVYFGGGTPSLMTPSIMEEIFAKIPGFRASTNKVFEAHPLFLSEEKIDVLAKYHFSYVTFGVQSFDSKVLAEQHRIAHNEEKLKHLIAYTQSQKIRVNCDLMAFLNDAIDEDLKRFERDLEIMANEYRPDTIDVYPAYQKTDHWIAPGVVHPKTLDILVKLRRVILKFLRRHPEYEIVGDLSLDKSIIQKNHRTNYILRRISAEEYAQMKRYSSSGYPSQPPYQNTIGLGGYGQRMPYTYQGHQFFVLLENRDWKPIFHQII